MKQSQCGHGVWGARLWLSIGSVFVICSSGISAAQTPLRPTNQVKNDSVNAVPSTQGDCPTWKPGYDIRLLLSGHAPQNKRQQVFVEVEKCAQTGSTWSQDVLGSLYYMGDTLPGAFVQRDLDKARLYLSNAASHGKILAMAKLAEVELLAGNYQEAMNWAQILAHYNPLLPKEEKVSDGYIAALLDRIYKRFDSKEMPSVADDLNAFIAGYDQQINASIGKTFLAPAPNDLRMVGNPDVPMPASMGGGSTIFSPALPIFQAGFAEYLVVFKPDGTVAQTWLLDAVPDPKLGDMLQIIADRLRVTPASPQTSGLRYAWVPVIFDDGRYTLKK